MTSSATEVWGTVPGFPGYMVSTHGRVRSRTVASRRQRGRVLKPHRKPSGHLTVELSADGRTSIQYVHRLVASTFLANPEGLPLVRHLNGDPGDNRATNLAYGTKADNVADDQRLGVRRIAARKRTTKETAA